MKKLIALVLWAFLLPTICYAQPSTLCFTTNGTNCIPVSPSVPLPVTTGITASSTFGLAPVVSASAEATHVFKATAGNLYSAYATNLTATAGFLVLIDATSAPVDGAITPLACVVLPSSGTASINYSSLPAVFATGITAVVTSAATCFTKTTGVITAYISGTVK